MIQDLIFINFNIDEHLDFNAHINIKINFKIFFINFFDDNIIIFVVDIKKNLSTTEIIKLTIFFMLLRINFFRQRIKNICIFNRICFDRFIIVVRRSNFLQTNAFFKF